jgi:hypothetical protein
MAVIVASGHMAKAFEKFTSWVGFLPYATAEPTGVQTALKMSAKTLLQPAPWFNLPTLSFVAVVLMILGIVFALREAVIADPLAGHKRLPSLLLLGGFYLFLVIGWSGLLG